MTPDYVSEILEFSWSLGVNVRGCRPTPSCVHPQCWCQRNTVPANICPGAVMQVTRRSTDKVSAFFAVSLAGFRPILDHKTADDIWQNVTAFLVLSVCIYLAIIQDNWVHFLAVSQQFKLQLTWRSVDRLNSTQTGSYASRLWVLESKENGRYSSYCFVWRK